VQPLPGNSLNLTLDRWIAYGGCLSINTFDAVMTEGSTERIAEFLDPGGSSGHYDYAAMTYRYDPTFNAKVVYCPYDLMFVYTDPEHPPEGNTISSRAQLLSDVLLAFGHLGGSPATPVPEVGVFTVRSYPNPFNPSVKIQYSLPRRGELTIKIYNLRGKLVRTLIDEVVVAGENFVMWDGTDGRGQAVASGAYFYEAVAAETRHVEKLMLVK
jgi:hypothetical protein